MPVGTVKWFDCRKGFGFIVDDQGRDVFVHFSVIEGDGFKRLRDGAQAEFEAADGPKGWSATRARELPDPAPQGAVEGSPATEKSSPG